MDNHVAKIIEIVGTSDVSIDEAIRCAIAKASETLDNLQWFKVIETRGAISNQKIERFQVILQIAFGLTD